MVLITGVDRTRIGYELDRLAADESDLWAVEPAPLDVWLKDRSMLGRMVLSDLQFEAVAVSERIFYPQVFRALGWPDIRWVSEVTLGWGKGSGKDFISRIILSRCVYLLWCLVSPQAYYGMPATETIALTNIAASREQARDAFFGPWARMMAASPFFKRIADVQTRRIEFDKNISAISGHSATRSQEGQNLLVTVLDEYAEFKTAAELAEKKIQSEREPVNSAEGIYKMARSSMLSRFGPCGKVISISYTRFRNDAQDQLLGRAEQRFREEGEASDHFSSRAATWDVRPGIRREFFDSEYEKDPTGSAALYECRPVSGTYSYFQNMLAVRKCMGILDLSIDPAFREADYTVGWRYFWGDDPKDTSGVLDDGSWLGHKPARWQIEYDLASLRKHRFPLAIHMDLGLTHSRAGIAASHLEGFVDRSEPQIDFESGILTEQVFRRPKIVTDFVIGLEPLAGDPERGYPPSDIQVRWIHQLVMELMAGGWVVSRFTADGFQSTYTRQTLSGWGIEVDLFSLDRTTEGYDTLKSLVYEQTVSAPFCPVLYREVEDLLKITANKIDHPQGGTKDLADAWAGSVAGAVWLAEERGWGQGEAITDDLSTDFATHMTEEAFREAAPPPVGDGSTFGSAWDRFARAW